MSIEPFDFTYTLTPQSKENEVLNALGKGRIKEFEPKSYFFTESTIAAQSIAEGAYGPDYVSTSTKFNITTQFELANKKAYAVTSGQVLIVPQSGEGNESKVNVFIKPLKHVDVGVPIKYYVYRGLKKELFINSSNNILPKNNTNTPFMAKVWTDLINFNELTAPLPEIPASLFGYSTTETDTNILDAKFFNTYNATSTDENKAYNLPIIEAGQYFGEFKDNKGGFEIVLNDGFYYQEKSDTGFQFDLNYAKAEKAVLDVANIANNPNISEKIYRENVQKFLDPAAFYGAHITEKEKGEVKIVDIGVKYSTKADIYNNIVSKFSNKNKCYIYLQCNSGRSFNFDEALGADPLKIGTSETLTASPYKTNEWPIIISEFEQTHTEDENNNRKGLNYLSFQLKFKTQTKNVTIYNTFGNCSNEKVKGNFLTNLDLVDENNIATQNYTNSVNYKLVNNYNPSKNNLVSKNIATFIYINYNEKEVDYFNDLFGPINIEPIVKLHGEPSNSIVQKTSNKNLRINSKDGIVSVYNQELIINGKIIIPSPPVSIIENSRTRLYVLKKLDSITNSEKKSSELMAFSDGFGYVNTKDQYGSYIYGDKGYIVWKGKSGSGTKAIKTLQLINFEQDSNATNFIQLGLTELDYNRLIYNNEEKIEQSTHLPKNATNIFFHLDDTGIIQNSEYKKYKLGVKYQTKNEIAFTFPTDDVYIYTIDGYYFFTKMYSEKFEFAEEFGKSTFNFRTKQDYRGEFGFDWLRIGDVNGELPYEDSIISGFEEKQWNGTGWDTQFDSRLEAFEALKKEYINIKTLVGQEIYYVPFLNIYPPDAIVGTPAPVSTVTLKVVADIKENTLNIRYDYDTTLFSVSSSLLTGSIEKGIYQNIEITIACLKEFDQDQIIKVIGTSQLPNEAAKENIIGVLKVCKNSRKTNNENLEVVIVKVITDIDKNGSEDTDPAYVSPEFMGIDEKNQLIYTLYQSLIYKENITISTASPLNMTEFPKFRKDEAGTYYRKVIAGGKSAEIEYLLDDGRIQDDLITELHAKQPEYDNYLKVFVFAVNGINADGFEIGGRAKKIGSRSCAMYRARPPKATLAHEVLHAIGLYHTHADGPIVNSNQRYVYPRYNSNASNGPITISGTTDNIMSYTSNAQITTWKWQWKILKSILNGLD